jgi:hypothetical protein
MVLVILIVLILVCAIYPYVAPVVISALIAWNMCFTGFNILMGDLHGGVSARKDDWTPEEYWKLKFLSVDYSRLPLKESCIKSYYTSDLLLVSPLNGFSDVRFLVCEFLIRFHKCIRVRKRQRLPNFFGMEVGAFCLFSFSGFYSDRMVKLKGITRVTKPEYRLISMIQQISSFWPEVLLWMGSPKESALDCNYSGHCANRVWILVYEFHCPDVSL